MFIDFKIYENISSFGKIRIKYTKSTHLFDSKLKSTFENKFSKGNENGVKKVTEFCKMSRDLSKIQLKKNIIAQEQETERKLVRSRSSIQGRNLFNVKEY